MPPALQTVASTAVFVAAFAAASGIAVAPAARAQCASTATSAITEARAARWLIGEDLHARAVTDQSRALVTQQLAAHGVAAPRWQPFADAALGYQGVLGLAACSAGSERNVALERFRLTGAAGLTHSASGFGVELSFVGARDQLVQSVGSEGDRDVLAGFGQGLVALRAGHEAWGRVLVGFTSPERRDRTLSLDPGRQPGTGQGFFYGVSVPALHLGVVTLAQRGAPELVQISAYDLEPPVLPVAVSLGPTYIREERQTVGWLRIRGVGLGGRTAPAATFAEDGTTAGTASQTRYLAPVLEASAESREARLRHGRFRIEGALRKTFVGRAASSLRRLAWISGHLEATVFRSRYFQDALAGSAQRAPGPAWGVGGVVTASGNFGPVVVGVEWGGAWNRPELLSLLPSAVDNLELRTGLTLALQN